MSTNLGQPNSYYRVRKGFTLYQLAGFRPSNRYYGASQLSDPIYTARQAKAGDELHNLHGGIFLVGRGETAGQGVLVRMKPYDWLAYNKHAGCWMDGSETFPLDLLKPIPQGRQARYVTSA